MKHWLILNKEQHRLKQKKKTKNWNFEWSRGINWPDQIDQRDQPQWTRCLNRLGRGRTTSPVAFSAPIPAHTPKSDTPQYSVHWNPRSEFKNWAKSHKEPSPKSQKKPVFEDSNDTQMRKSTKSNESKRERERVWSKRRRKKKKKRERELLRQREEAFINGWANQPFGLSVSDWLVVIRFSFFVLFLILMCEN